MITIALLVVGFLLLLGGSELLVRGSSALALRIGMTPLVIGLTVVALGTSSPELAVSAKASLSGNGSVALGNIVGSNICNVGLILGISALLRPLTVERKVIRQEIPVVLAASTVFLIFVANGTVSRLEGIISLLVITAYMVFIVRQSRAVTGASRAVTRQRRTLNRQKASEASTGASTGTEALNPEAVIPSAGLPLYLCLLFVVLGGGMLVFGSRFLVRGAITVAELAGMSEAVIGLTIIAIGTSLPELVTSVVAALKKEVDIAVGNVVGSNLFNLLAIGGTASLINPMGSGEMSYLDFGVMLGFTILLLPFLRTKFTLSRVEGFIFVAVYGFYTTYLVTTAIS